MGTVPQDYFSFIMDYAPYFYYIPGTGVDTEWERGPAPAAHAIDFLAEAHQSSQFEDKQADIFNKIVELADYLVSIQCTDDQKQAYGGFQSKDGSNHYYSIDALRAVPALLKAYDLTGNSSYLNAATLAGGTFLYNMQHQPSNLGEHDQYYGGFAQAVTIADDWLAEMHVIDLYGLIGLQMLYSRTGETVYQSMMQDEVGFYRGGFEALYSRYSPAPNGDGEWHRVEESNVVYDDDFGYALVGLFSYEGWSSTVKQVYEDVNGIGPSADYPAYNPAVCWSGYVDVVSRKVDSDYYDAVAAGILWQLRSGHDNSALEFSFNVIGGHSEEFMFWGTKFNDYGAVENKKSVVTVSWLSLMFLNYQPPITPFTRILRCQGIDVTVYPVVENKQSVNYGEGIKIKALVCPARTDEIIMEQGYIVNDYITVHTFAPILHHNKLRYKGTDYEVGPVEGYSFRGQLMFRRSVCRRLIS
ncbi:MAG: hypothetical protein CW691_07385 [Candidatus Bathyarchaeum sp.]|nr:MAG: hypothetical protein CW691_07385 [Candidatus Bathyarchaeum sp.]